MTLSWMQMWWCVVLFTLYLPSLSICSDICDMYDATVFYCNCVKVTEADEAEGVACTVYYESSVDSEEWDIFKGEDHLTDIELLSRSGALNYLPRNVLDSVPNLKHFKLRDAFIDKIPQNAFHKLNFLELINLSGNEITVLEPEAFHDLPRLRQLTLSENNLTEVGKSAFVSLPNLKKLYLDKNMISVIHERAFRKLRSLVDLDLRKNRIVTLSKDTFVGLKSLEELVLANNLMKEIPRDLLRDLKNLKSINLNYNQLTHLGDGTFKDLHALSSLHLMGNPLKTLGNAFGGNDKLYYVDLRENHLETITRHSIQPLWFNFNNESMQLYLSGNPFVCSCSMIWMQELYSRKSYFIPSSFDKTTCQLSQFEDSGRSNIMEYLSNMCSSFGVDNTEAPIISAVNVKSVHATPATLPHTTEELPAADTHSPHGLSHTDSDHHHDLSHPDSGHHHDLSHPDSSHADSSHKGTTEPPTLSETHKIVKDSNSGSPSCLSSLQLTLTLVFLKLCL